MALFRPTLGELSGSVGNTVFSHSKSGATLRRRSVPVQPAGRAGGVVRNGKRVILAQVSAAWATLTGSQQDDWRNWATNNPSTNALGDRHELSGHQAFVGLNTRRRTFNLSIVTTPPIDQAPAALAPTASSFPDGTHLRLTFNPATIPAAVKAVLWMSRPHSGGKKPNRRQAVICAGLAGGTVTPANWPLAYNVQVGQSATFWIEVWRTSDMLKSVAFRLDLTR